MLHQFFQRVQTTLVLELDKSAAVSSSWWVFYIVSLTGTIKCSER